jgi:tRNA(Ile2) C34 agmatinyltransferase TiaS
MECPKCGGQMISLYDGRLKCMGCGHIMPKPKESIRGQAVSKAFEKEK